MAVGQRRGPAVQLYQCLHVQSVRARAQACFVGLGGLRAWQLFLATVLPELLQPTRCSLEEAGPSNPHSEALVHAEEACGTSSWLMQQALQAIFPYKFPVCLTCFFTLMTFQPGHELHCISSTWLSFLASGCRDAGGDTGAAAHGTGAAAEGGGAR